MRNAVLSAVSAVPVVALAAGLLATPAAADNDMIGEAAAAMLQARDVPNLLGQPGAHQFMAEHKTRAVPWVCTIGDKDLAGKPAVRMYESSYWLAKNGRLELSQTAFSYKSASATKSAWQDLKAKVKKCKGTTTNGNWMVPGGIKYTVVLDNGVTDELYDGRKGVWVTSDFEASSAQADWTEDEFVVFFRSGNSIQLVDFDAKPDSKKISTKKREAVEALGEVLDQRWRAFFG